MRAGSGSWADERNRSIAIGYSIYRRSLHRCGQPLEKAYSGSINGWIQAEWVKCNFCEAQERAVSDLGADDPRRGQAWGAIPVDHFPYGDRDEPFKPWRLEPRELDI